MSDKNFDKDIMEEFIKFVEADPVSPKTTTDNSIHKMVEKSLNPSIWMVFVKFFSIEAAAGLATLLVCPQFNIDFGSHNELFHSLHSNMPPFLFFIVCGIFFVLLGAALAGLILSHDEIRKIKTAKYIYYTAYSLTAYIIFVSLGAEIFLLSSIAWIFGVIAGNFVGFEAITRMKMVRA
ncbi:MAG: hypothetical protein GY834_08515 [Bacteroidetes bacterium]|nr:hypothetical protein [Bacteroidota bacterium]